MRAFYIIVGVIIVAILVWGFATGWGKGGSSDRTPEQIETSSEPISGEVKIKISNLSFNPETVTISKGSKVIWTNNEAVIHTITSDNGEFTSSGQLNQGQSYEFTFADSGEFPYHCTPHPNMTAKIIVK